MRRAKLHPRVVGQRHLGFGNHRPHKSERRPMGDSQAHVRRGWHTWRVKWDDAGMRFWKDYVDGAQPYFNVPAYSIADWPFNDPGLSAISDLEACGCWFGWRRSRARHLSGRDARRLGTRLVDTARHERRCLAPTPLLAQDTCIAETVISTSEAAGLKVFFPQSLPSFDQDVLRRAGWVDRSTAA